MTNLSFDFAGRSVIVTGAARGVGLAIATLFARSGASTFMVDFDAEALQESARAIGGIPLQADVSSSDDVERVVATVADTTGRVDIVVNNAGVLRDGVVWKMSDAEWDTVLNVHLGGTFRFTRAAVPHFRKQEFGRIINITSYSGLRGNIGQANYSAAKAGIIGFTKTTAKELGRFGVTVNAISPNAETRMIESLPDAKRAELAAQTPLGRWGSPDEMATAVAFLASDEAQYITGALLAVDGGLSI